MNHPSNPEHRDEQLLDQLVEQFTQAIRAGEKPEIADWQKQHPHLASEIHELLSSVAMIESLKQDDPTLSPAPEANRKRLEIAQLGDYRIIEELGRGGMGVVLLGVHESLGRRVAIKVMPAHLSGDDKYVERFRREAQAAATLHHTNIVGVFGVGRSDGYHYYVMEYIDGCGLNRIISRISQLEKSVATGALNAAPTLMAESPQPDIGRVTCPDDLRTRIAGAGDQDLQVVESPAADPAEPLRFPALPTGSQRYRWAAELCLRIADALEYAHGQGKLHRDIKPSNLLLDHEGRVWLADFGLVKTVSGHTMTGTGEIVGTPQYMAPESFSGKYGIPSETYCLGLTLHELLALQPAFSSEHTTELIRQVTTTSPAPLRKIDPGIPRDLAMIVEKATNRDEQQRYKTAGQMRDDLRAWLDGRPIQARRAAIHRRLWLWSKRNPWAALSAGLVGLVALTATIGYLLVSAAYRELEVRHHQLEGQQKLTRAARQAAEENATRFRDQYLRAESNIQLTMELFDEMFKKMVLRGSGSDGGFAFDGFQELLGVETAVTASDAEFLEDMLVFFERFAEANVENTELQGEAARAFRRVANIYHLTGKSGEAVEAYRRALGLYATLEKQSGPSVSLRVLQARTGTEMALAKSREGNYREAMNGFREVQQQLETGPLASEIAVRFEVARTLNLAGSLLPATHPDEGTNVLASLMPADFRDRLRQRRGPGGRRRSGRTELQKNQETIHQAIAILDQLIREEGRQPQFVLERTKSHARLSELQFHARDSAASGTSRDMAVQDLEGLIDQFPDQSEYQAVLAQVLALPADQSPGERLEQLARSGQLTESLVEALPHNLDYAQLDAEVHYQIGQIHAALQAPEPAIEAWQRAVGTLRQVTGESPQNREAQLNLAVVTLELAETLLAEQQFTDARALLRAATSGALRQSRGQRSLPLARLVLARYYELLAAAATGLGDDRGARQASRQAQLLQSREDGPPPLPPTPRRDSR